MTVGKVGHGFIKLSGCFKNCREIYCVLGRRIWRFEDYVYGKNKADSHIFVVYSCIVIQKSDSLNLSQD